MTPAGGIGLGSWRPLLVLRIRIGRFLWRILPLFGVAALLWAGARILQSPASLLRLADIVVVGVLIYAVLRALIREVLSPEQPSLRLLPLNDARARMLTAGLSFFLSAVVFAEVGRRLVLAAPWHLSVAEALTVLRNVAFVVACVLLVGATGLFRWLRTRSGATFWGLVARFTGRILVPLTILAMLFLVVAQGLGYVPLARYVSRNLVSTGVRLVAGVIVYHYLRKALGNTIRILRGEPRDAGAAATSEADLASVEADPALLGAERIVEATLRFVVVLATILWVFDAWSLSPANVWDALNTPIIGEEGVTWARMLGGILKIVAVFAAGWLLRTILTYFVFPRTTMEVGARYAILAVLRYVVIALAIIFALDSLGLDTSSLGWFFGAAGVGIGLGLQDVIGNFFSGLIMLVERPIRVGDTVQIGDAVGKVEDIRMRGTVIRTFDNTSVTIPNRQMLGERVTNLSYGMRHARVKIELGVDYGTNPIRIRQILLDIARAHPDVLADPEPIVWFSNFGQSSIDFTLICYTEKVTGRFGVASELRFEIFQTLGREGIQIPFPQMDVHIKTGGPETLETGFRA